MFSTHQPNTGIKSMTDSECLNLISDLLSGTEWNIDTLISISDLVTSTGREIKDLEEE
jgi:hypothetical protein